MALKTLFLAALAVTALALSGCADAPPTGTFATDRETASAETAGSATIVYTAFHSPSDEGAGGAPGTVEDATGVPARCGGDEALGQDPSGTTGEYQCTDPSTQVRLDFDSLPEPGAAGYTAFLVGESGELELGALDYNEHAEHMEGAFMYSINWTADEDLSGMYDSVEVRHGSFVLARASAAGGTNGFELAPDAVGFEAEVSFEGMGLTVTVTGAPPNATLTGWLVATDPLEGELVHEESFELTGDTTQFTAPKVITEYAEFHVHVADSKINIAIATIPQAGA